MDEEVPKYMICLAHQIVLKHQKNCLFHWFLPGYKDEANKTMVFRNLLPIVSTEEILQDLKSRNFEVLRAVQMQNKTGEQTYILYTLYVVLFKKSKKFFEEFLVLQDKNYVDED